MFHSLCGQSHKTVSINHIFLKRKESRSGSNHRAILTNVSLIVWAKSRDSVHKPQFLKRKESRSGSNPIIRSLGRSVEHWPRLLGPSSRVNRRVRFQCWFNCSPLWFFLSYLFIRLDGVLCYFVPRINVLAILWSMCGCPCLSCVRVFWNNTASLKHYAARAAVPFVVVSDLLWHCQLVSELVGHWISTACQLYMVSNNNNINKMSFSVSFLLQSTRPIAWNKVS